MPLQSVENQATYKRKYHLHIDLDVEYEPLYKRNTGNTLSNTQKQSARMAGAKNIDVWTDGKIYPVDPTSLSTPNFSTATTLLKFAGDGHKGLLGYCNNLHGSREEVFNNNQLLISQINDLIKQQQAATQKVASLNETIQILEKDLKISRSKKTGLGWRQRTKSLANIETLKLGSGGLKKRIGCWNSSVTSGIL